MAKAHKIEPEVGLAPFALKDAPSFIERQFPVGRLSAEAYKERKAGAGQTLTALGSYWKGRKPLVLVRAVGLNAPNINFFTDWEDETLLGMGASHNVASSHKSALSRSTTRARRRPCQVSAAFR